MHQWELVSENYFLYYWFLVQSQLEELHDKVNSYITALVYATSALSLACDAQNQKIIQHGVYLVHIKYPSAHYNYE